MSDFTKSDMVNHPAHYISEDGIEVIDVIKAFTKEMTGMEAVCTANAIKYVLRWKNKNGVEDIKKAIWYLNKLVSVKESGASMDEEEKDKQDDSWRSDFTPQMISDFKKGKFGYIVPTDKLSSFLWHLRSVAPDIRWNRGEKLTEWHPRSKNGYAIYSMLAKNDGLTYDYMDDVRYLNTQEHEYFICAEECNPYELIVDGEISVLIRNADEYTRFINGMKEHAYPDVTLAETGRPLSESIPCDDDSPFVIDIYDKISAVWTSASDVDTERHENRLIFDITRGAISWLCDTINTVTSFSKEEQEEDNSLCDDSIITEFVNGNIGVIVHNKDEWLDFASLVRKKHRELTWNSKAELNAYIPTQLQCGEAIVVTAKSSIFLDTHCNNRVCYYHEPINEMFKDARELDSITTFYDFTSGCCVNARDPKNITICSLCKMH